MESNDFDGGGCWFAHEKPAFCRTLMLTVRT
jgi:hypothetical protein